MSTGGRRGFFLVFEGVEGAGKSTHARLLHRRLRDAGVPATLVREPGGTEAGERIREIVLDPALEVSPETELLLVLAARAQIVGAVVEPALERGEVVVADRYEMSTLAYQGLARGLGLDRVRELNDFATRGLRPDATVVLEVAPERGLGRKGGGRDRLEREDAGFHRKVAEAYAVLAREMPDVIRVRSDATREEVEARILRLLAERWPETFGDIGCSGECDGGRGLRAPRENETEGA